MVYLGNHKPPENGMAKYTAWFSDEGENKGDEIDTFSDFDAAVLYLIEHQEDVLDESGLIYVRAPDRSVREFKISELPVLPLGQTN